MTAELAAALRRCHSAEDYFALLDVAYDPQVVAVNRLHILRHFSAQLAELESAGGAPDRTECQAALVRSYQAFTTGTALDHRLFKVLRDHAPAAFVPVTEVAVLRGAS